MARGRTNKDKNYIPSTASPTHGRKGCLCKDGRKYSRKCCDGSVQAQGIGAIRKQVYFEPEINVGATLSPPMLGYSFSSPELGSIDFDTWEDKRLLSVLYVVSSKKIVIEFEGNKMNAFNSFRFGINNSDVFPPLVYVKRTDFDSEYDSIRDVTIFSYYIGYTFLQPYLTYKLRFS